MSIYLDHASKLVHVKVKIYSCHSETFVHDISHAPMSIVDSFLTVHLNEKLITPVDSLQKKLPSKYAHN